LGCLASSLDSKDMACIQSHNTKECGAGAAREAQRTCSA
jgi:hypothetical protein